MQILCPTCRLAFAAIARPVCLWPQTWHRVGKLRNMNSEHFWTASDKSILGYHTYVYILEKSSRKYNRIFYHRMLFGFWPLRHAETVYHTVAAVMQSSCWKIRSQTKDSRFNATAFEFWVNKYKQVTNRLNRPASHSSIQRYEVVWMCETALWWWTLMFGDPGYWMILVDIGSSRQATFVDSGNAFDICTADSKAPKSQEDYVHRIGRTGEDKSVQTRDLELFGAMIKDERTCNCLQSATAVFILL